MNELAKKLADYTLTLDADVVICDRRVVDEAIESLHMLEGIPVFTHPAPVEVDAREVERLARQLKGGWIITSYLHGDLNDFSFASAKEAWIDAYDTVRMAPNGSSIRNTVLAAREDDRHG